MTASLIVLPGTGEKVITQKNGSDEHAQAVFLVRSDTLDPVTVEADGQKVYLGLAIPAGDANIGNVDIVTLPADPLGANADAGTSGAGSINAHLRFIAATGIPVTALPALPAGTDHIGTVQPSDGTNDQTFLALTSGNAALMALADSEGAQVSLAPDKTITPTFTLDTGALIAGDVMAAAVIAFADAGASSGGGGHILGMAVVDNDDLGAAGDFAVHFYNSSVTPAAANAAHSLSDADGAKYVGSLLTTSGTWVDNTLNQTMLVQNAQPIPFTLAGTANLYAVMVAIDGQTRTASGIGLKLYVGGRY